MSTIRMVVPPVEHVYPHFMQHLAGIVVWPNNTDTQVDFASAQEWDPSRLGFSWTRSTDNSFQFTSFHGPMTEVWVIGFYPPYRSYVGWDPATQPPGARFADLIAGTHYGRVIIPAGGSEVVRFRLDPDLFATPEPASALLVAIGLTVSVICRWLWRSRRGPARTI